MVRREHAEDYLLISLVTFGATVIFTRAFLHITGFPQLGNNVLHIAHALWGGLFLFIAGILTLVLANRWAIQASALLGGIGIGLFIDEVGKLITHTNDYFFPPALSIIYSFFLLVVFVYLYFRRPLQGNPRHAMYHVLEELKDALDGDLDQAEAARIEAHLAIAQTSEREEITVLAQAIGEYIHKEKQYLADAQPDIWKRTVRWIDTVGLKLGRRTHHKVISIILILWGTIMFSYIGYLLFASANLADQVLQWRGVLLLTQVLIGGLMIIALYNWLKKNEGRGVNIALGGFLLSLVALQTLYFYLTQFSAVISTLLQLGCLLVLLAYRRLYLSEGETDPHHQPLPRT
jgi:hypothetical protein